MELVKSIGADHVIDYTEEDFTDNGQLYDLIYDAVGNRSVSHYARALKPNGKCVIAGFTTLPHIFSVIIVGGIFSQLSSKWIGLQGTAQPNKEDLQTITELMESKKVVPVIDTSYPLRETPEAIRYLETGRARGKVIINVLPT